jgi:hypothetical protein
MDRCRDDARSKWQRVIPIHAVCTAVGSPELSKGWRPITEEVLVRRVDAGVSPYLQQPLRTLEKAEQDCNFRQRENADVEV